MNDQCRLCCLKLRAFNKAFVDFFVAVRLNKEALSTTFFINIVVNSIQCRPSDSAVHKFLNSLASKLSSHQNHSKDTPSLSEHLTAMSSASQPPMRAMIKVLEAFARWCREEGRAEVLAIDISPMTDALGIDFQPEVKRPIPCPAPTAFVRSLPSVDLGELAGDSQDCGICTQPMAPLGSSSGDVIKDLNDDVKEEAKRLPCSHIMGMRCLAQWFDPMNPSNNNTCPFCRAVCFRKFPATLAGAQARLDAFDWHIQQRGTGATAEESVQTKLLTSLILQDWLIEALIELEEGRAEVDKEMYEQFGIVNATYHGPLRNKSWTNNLRNFFNKQGFLHVLMRHLAPMQLGSYLGDGADALVQLFFGPESGRANVH